MEFSIIRASSADVIKNLADRHFLHAQFVLSYCCASWNNFSWCPMTRRWNSSLQFFSVSNCTNHETVLLLCLEFSTNFLMHYLFVFISFLKKGLENFGVRDSPYHIISLLKFFTGLHRPFLVKIVTEASLRFNFLTFESHRILSLSLLLPSIFFHITL